MSVWKKASKSNQNIHRERRQPEERKHLGLLEKKKDYVKRARDYNEKQTTLKLLRRKALNKNPDEFYHHMINSKTDNGIHHEKEIVDEDTPEQLALMRSQDLKYITLKRTQEQKKIERLQSQLHLTSVNHKVKAKHVYFKHNIDEDNGTSSNILMHTNLPEINWKDLAEGTRRRKNIYGELAKRINREKELSVIQQKIEMKRHVENRKSVLPPKKVKKGTKEKAPVYVWRYERKK